MQSSFYDEPARVKKRLEESREAAQYYTHVPGPGSQLPFFQSLTTIQIPRNPKMVGEFIHGYSEFGK